MQKRFKLKKHRLDTLESDEKIMQVSPKILYHHQKSTIWYAGGKVNLPIGYIRHKDIRKKDISVFSLPSETDYATGCCICMRSNDFNEIGRFDNSFPMYCEDVDLSIRFKKIGGKVYYVPESIIWHKVSFSIGGGQVSRVDAVDIAIKKSGERASDSILCSDAFFPFRDSIDRIADAGVKAVVQPGGSIRDDEVISACNEHGVAMVFTGKRCFKH